MSALLFLAVDITAKGLNEFQIGVPELRHCKLKPIYITASELGTLTINHVASDVLNFHHVLILPSLILFQTTEGTSLIIFCIYFMLE